MKFDGSPEEAERFGETLDLKFNKKVYADRRGGTFQISRFEIPGKTNTYIVLPKLSIQLTDFCSTAVQESHFGSALTARKYCLENAGR